MSNEAEWETTTTVHERDKIGAGVKLQPPSGAEGPTSTWEPFSTHVLEGGKLLVVWKRKVGGGA